MEGHARVAKGSARAFPCFSFAFHLLHSRSRVLVDPWSFVEWHPATAIWMCRRGECDCDHHVCGTRLWDRGEMVSLFQNKTSSLRRIVLSPLPISGCDLFLQFQSRFSEWEEFTWRVAAPQRAQSALLWNVSCISGSQGKGFQAKALRGRCNSWMRANSSCNHVRAGGIGGVNLVSMKSVVQVRGSHSWWV